MYNFNSTSIKVPVESLILKLLKNKNPEHDESVLGFDFKFDKIISSILY